MPPLSVYHPWGLPKQTIVNAPKYHCFHASTHIVRPHTGHIIQNLPAAAQELPSLSVEGSDSKCILTAVGVWPGPEEWSALPWWCVKRYNELPKSLQHAELWVRGSAWAGSHEDLGHNPQYPQSTGTDCCVRIHGHTLCHSKVLVLLC